MINSLFNPSVLLTFTQQLNYRYLFNPSVLRTFGFTQQLNYLFNPSVLTPLAKQLNYLIYCITDLISNKILNIIYLKKLAENVL